MLSFSSLITNFADLPSQLSEKLSGRGSQQGRRGGWIPLPTSPNTSYSSPSDVDPDSPGREFGTYHRRHRRWSSLSRVRVLKRRAMTASGLLGLLVGVMFVFGLAGVWRGSGLRGWLGSGSGAGIVDDGGVIPLGQSRMREGQEVFWWEQFGKLSGYWTGRQGIVSVTTGDWKSEQDGGLVDYLSDGDKNDGSGIGLGSKDVLVNVGPSNPSGRKECYLNEDKRIKAPAIMAYIGTPQGFPRPLFGSAKVVGLRDDVCYDRIDRFGPYGYGFTEEEGGLGIGHEGDTDGSDTIKQIDFENTNWKQVQDTCIKKNGNGNRTAFLIRTWHGYEYTPYHVLMLRAMVSELALASGGRYEVHFLVHVQNDSIPIWASKEVYDQVLAESLPREFAGMGSLWSVAQMKLIYPPPFPQSLVNFSGDDIYKAYRSLHFPLQYFATNHPEFDFYWHWEMDIRVTGHYLELLDQISKFADSQPRKHLWAESSEFFIPALYNQSDDIAAYEMYVKSTAISDHSPITGPQLRKSDLLDLPFDTSTSASTLTDLITFNPLFDPNNTLWAFRDDITSYNRSQRPPTRAALITASRLSRRLLLTMHHETYRNKHTMFPEMYPASIALHYGYTATSVPLPIYHERYWDPHHANVVFNNAPISPESPEARDRMNHGTSGGKFHGETGSVFGPGEHVFRGASYYSNAWFAEDLWRRWLGIKDWMGLSEESTGRLCYPMMVLHPVKHDEQEERPSVVS